MGAVVMLGVLGALAAASTGSGGPGLEFEGLAWGGVLTLVVLMMV